MVVTLHKASRSIKWPEQYSQNNVDVHVSNELEMSVPADIVWAWLIRAKLWPTWYRNSANVIIDDGKPDLHLGTQFKWKTFGLNLESKVEEFVPYERLAWTAHGIGIDAYHAWLIEKRESGCYVLTEENQRGILARLNKLFRPNNMEKYHQIWLEELYSKAGGGLPP
jgi:hypothetical protein